MCWLHVETGAKEPSILLQKAVFILVTIPDQCLSILDANVGQTTCVSLVRSCMKTRQRLGKEMAPPFCSTLFYCEPPSYAPRVVMLLAVVLDGFPPSVLFFPLSLSVASRLLPITPEHSFAHICSLTHTLTHSHSPTRSHFRPLSQSSFLFISELFLQTLELLKRLCSIHSSSMEVYSLHGM